jgi:hypothetical protein
VSRATDLTRTVTAVPRHVVARGTVEQLRARLAAGLAPAAPGVGRDGPFVVTLPLLCRAQARPAVSRSGGAFAWSPFFVRRSLGAAIVDECLRDRRRSPAEVAVAVLEGALAGWRRTGERRFHWEPWVAGLPPAGRANVLADAVTWATALWSSFDWAAFPERPLVGGPPEQWTTPEAPGVRLTSRTDLKVQSSGAPAGSAVPGALAVVTVLNGAPPPSGSAALAYPALVSALCAPWRGAPARSVGLWPDAGHVESVDVDAAVLEAAADLVIETVVRWSRRAAPSVAGRGAANGVPAGTRSAAG